MIPRIARGRLASLIDSFPATLVLGPRQCGKTTLAREIVGARYLDLEKPSDRQVLSGDAEYTLRSIASPVILDEAQTLPELFPVLRALIDEQRSRNGRFILLGSVSPSLVGAISESLAGRVGILELTPLLLPEARAGGLDIREHWLRGGFPSALLEPRPVQRHDWFEAYVRTFVERDIRMVAPRLMPAQLRRFVTMLAHYHGAVLNASDLGRSLGVNYQTVQTYLELLEGFFLLRRLPPFHVNLGKRLVKSPKVYLRDSGVLHHLLGVGEADVLAVSPKRGESWEGFVIEQILAREALERPSSQAFFYRTQAGAEIDLVVDRGTERLGFEIKAATNVGPGDWRTLKSALDDGIIDHGFVVYLGTGSFPASRGIDVVAADEMLLRGMARPLP